MKTQQFSTESDSSLDCDAARKECDHLRAENTRLHEENRQRVEANIARARPLHEAANHYALCNAATLNATCGALETAFILGANWQKESRT